MDQQNSFEALGFEEIVYQPPGMAAHVPTDGRIHETMPGACKAYTSKGDTGCSRQGHDQLWWNDSGTHDSRDQRSVYVSNIHPNTSKDQLQHLFSSCGCIRHVTIPKSSATQQPLGHAYIEFSSPAAAQAAVKLSRQQLQGQQISVHLKQTNIQGYDVFQGHVGFSRRGRRGMGGTGNSFGRQGAAFPEWGQ